MQMALIVCELKKSIHDLLRHIYIIPNMLHGINWGTINPLTFISNANGLRVNCSVINLDKMMN